MKCDEFEARLDDYLDGGQDERAMREHLNVCGDCRRLHHHAVTVQAALRAISPPDPHPEFLDRAIARASRPDAGEAHPARRAALGVALAATLLLGVGAGAYLTLRAAPVQMVALTVEEPETVRMVFDSAKPLRAATINITLPENLDLVGYAGRRELTWQADLREGQNLLQLPLVAHGTVKDELRAKLTHGSGTKTFRVKFDVARADRPGM
jgi:hypothetical protein